MVDTSRQEQGNVGQKQGEVGQEMGEVGQEMGAGGCHSVSRESFSRALVSLFCLEGSSKEENRKLHLIIKFLGLFYSII